MISAFTIAFEFEGKTYLALTTLKKGQDPKAEYSVRLFADSLLRIVPGGQLTYRGKGLDEGCRLNHPLGKRLSDCIRRSVDGHLRGCGCR